MSQFLSSIALTPSAPAAPEILDATHMTSSSEKSRETIYGTSVYSSKALTWGFQRGVHACQGVYPGGHPQLFARFLCRHPPGEDTPTPFVLVAQWTACHSFSNSKVLWKLRTRQSSSSSWILVIRPSLDLPSANASPTRSTCMPLSQRSNRQSVLAQISLSLWAPSVFVKTTWANTRGRLEFHFQSITFSHSSGSTIVSRRPILPGGVAYQLAYCAASWRLQIFHMA